MRLYILRQNQAVRLRLTTTMLYNTVRAGLTNVGALFGKMCGGPLPPYAVESRIESKMVHPLNLDKRPTTILHEL